MTVVENAVEPLMKMRNVVAAVQIIIDKNFPVAVDRIAPAVHPAEGVESQFLHSTDQIRAKKALERRSLTIELHKNPVLPDSRLDRRQTIRRAIEAADAGEIRGPAKGPFERVGPAVIRTTKIAGLSSGRGHDGGGMVTAYIEEAAQYPIVSSDDQKRLSSQFPRNVLSGHSNLVDAPNDLPGTREDRPALDLRYPGIH